MRIGVVGGALQGMESVYLARKARYSTLVLDRRADAPALSLADESAVVDVVGDRARAMRALADCDVILPANENIQALTSVVDISTKMNVPLLFDMNAYQISQSKIQSNALFKTLGIPMPTKWPACGFPLIVKPSIGSGSEDVIKAHDENEMRDVVQRFERANREYVIEEYVHGPNISIEVVGNGEDYLPFIITEVVLDENYDCKRVLSPYTDTSNVSKVFTEAAVSVARELNLKGVMDVEAIVTNDVPKILEIDARIPSQTPAAFLHSHGINLVEQMIKAKIHNDLATHENGAPRASVYEHIYVNGDSMRSCGEGIFAGVQYPYITRGLFGVDEMITDYQPGKENWMATLMMTAPTRQGLKVKREACLRRIMEENSISHYSDPFPEGYCDPADR